MYFIERLKTYVKRLLMYSLYAYKGVENKAVFESFSGQTYSDNPKAISEKLHELCPEIEIVWLFTNPDSKRTIVPDYVRVEKRCTKNMIKEYGTAKFWVNNFCMQEFVYKGKKQTYIQTWHGDRPFKKVIYESEKLNFKKGEVRESKICDLCVAGSDMGEHVYRAAFLYNGEIMKYGSPRADILVNGDAKKREKIKEELGIPQDAKTIMYAPTFRDNKGFYAKQKVDVLDYDRLLDFLKINNQQEWYCLLRVHPSMKIKEVGENKNLHVINVSTYEDMTDLLLISDILLTDYSSSAGDFILQDKLLILFQYDLELYEQEDRELHFKMKDSPFFSVKTQEEMESLFSQMTYDKIRENCEAIRQFYGTVETGESTKKVCEYIKKKLKDKI